MAAFAYPTDVPMDELKELLAILMGQKPPTLKLAAHNGWVVQGYLQGLLIGEASPDAVSTKDLKPEARLTDTQTMQALQVLAGSRSEKADLKAQGILGDLGGGALKTGLAKLILPILLGWIKKWITGGGLEDLIGKIGAGV